MALKILIVLVALAWCVGLFGVSYSLADDYAHGFTVAPGLFVAILWLAIPFYAATLSPKRPSVRPSNPKPE